MTPLPMVLLVRATWSAIELLAGVALVCSTGGQGREQPPVGARRPTVPGTVRVPRGAVPAARGARPVRPVLPAQPRC